MNNNKSSYLILASALLGIVTMANITYIENILSRLFTIVFSYLETGYLAFIITNTVLAVIIKVLLIILLALFLNKAASGFRFPRIFFIVSLILFPILFLLSYGGNLLGTSMIGKMLGHEVLAQVYKVTGIIWPISGVLNAIIFLIFGFILSDRLRIQELQE